MKLLYFVFLIAVIVFTACSPGDLPSDDPEHCNECGNHPIKKFEIYLFSGETIEGEFEHCVLNKITQPAPLLFDVDDDEVITVVVCGEKGVYREFAKIELEIEAIGFREIR